MRLTENIVAVSKNFKVLEHVNTVEENMKVSVHKRDLERELEITLDLNSPHGCARTIVLLNFILKEDNLFPFDEDARKAVQDIYTEAIRQYPSLLKPD